MIYVFYPDKAIGVFDDWPDLPDEPFILGTILYEPADKVNPWVLYTNTHGGLISKNIKDLPNWVQAYALLI